MFQMKEQDRTSERELGSAERSNLPDEELRVLVIKMLISLRRRDEISKKFNRERETIKRNPSELKST